LDNANKKLVIGHLFRTRRTALKHSVHILLQ